MNIRKLIAAILLFSGFPALLIAQNQSSLQSTSHPSPSGNTHSFTLQDCISYALEHQDTVVNAGLDTKSADYRVKEIRGIGLPQINGSASFQDYIKTPTQLFPDFISPAVYGVLNQEGVKNGSGQVIQVPTSFSSFPVSFYQKYTTNIGLTFSQILFDGSYLVGLKASKTYKELALRNLSRSRISTTVNVTKAYYQVLVSNEQIKLLNANMNQLKQQLDQTTAQNKQGFVEKIDVDRLDYQYNALQTQRDNIIRLLVLNYELLKFQMGMPVSESLMLVDKLENVNFDETTAQILPDTSVYRNRVEYGLQETNVRLNELALKRQRSLYLPSLSFNGGTSLLYQNNNFGDLFSTNYPSTYIGLSLNVPIFNGLQRHYQEKQAQITVKKSKNDLDNLKNALNLQADYARITYLNGLNTLKSQRHNQQLAQDVLRVAKIKYQQGVGSSLEVTQAQTALEDADNRYIQGLYDALVSKVDLDKAYGRIQ